MNIVGKLTAGLLLAAAIGAGPALAGGWSAISVDFRNDMTKTVYGIGRGGSASEAGSAALDFCTKAGGGNCKVVVSYTNCGAFAAGTSNVGWGMAMDKGTAEANARAGCGAESCRIIVSDCNN